MTGKGAEGPSSAPFGHAETEELSASVREITTQVTRSADIARNAAGEAQRSSENAKALSASAQGIGEVVEMTGSAATQLMSLSGALQTQAANLKNEVAEFVKGLRSA